MTHYNIKHQLPADPDGLNHERSAWADTAIRAFQNATGADDEDVLSDLLANLMHWSERHCYDFDAALCRARGHYDAETACSDQSPDRDGFVST